MQQVTLQNTQIVTSPLGFGCATLLMHDRREEALAMLHAALDLGITHFDVAPLYGIGQAEEILGEFIKDKRAKLTVTTKFGLAPPPSLAKHRRLVSLARKLSRRLTFLRRLKRRAQMAVTPRNAYTPQEALQSLETSLRKLNTDYVDILELHDPNDLSSALNDDLLAFLEQQRQAGRIRAAGVAMDYRQFAGDAATVPAALSVLQFDSNACAANLQQLRNREGRGLITFNSIRPAKQLVESARARPQLLKSWGERVGFDLKDLNVVSALMVKHAVMINPRGIALFTTTKRQNLQSNVRLFDELHASDAQLHDFASFARLASSAGQPAAAAT